MITETLKLKIISMISGNENELLDIISALSEFDEDSIEARAIIRLMFHLKVWDYKNLIFSTQLKRFFDNVEKFPNARTYISDTRKFILDTFNYDIPDPISPMIESKKKKVSSRKKPID